MGVTATTRLPAGWYPDPDGGGQRRWWDGQEWTQYTAEFQRPTSVDELVLVPEAPEEPKRARPSAERLGRWLAGAVHFGPSLKKRRRAHRSTD